MLSRESNYARVFVLRLSNLQGQYSVQLLDGVAGANLLPIVDRTFPILPSCEACQIAQAEREVTAGTSVATFYTHVSDQYAPGWSTFEQSVALLQSARCHDT